MSKWHIARINDKLNTKCFTQQRKSNLKCTAKIEKDKKGTPTPTYRWRKEDYNSKWEVLADFWFCGDDIDWCVKGKKHKWIIDWLEVPEVWPVLTRTNLNWEETLLLQHVGFHLQEQPTLLPRRFFSMSNIFKSILYNQQPPKDADVYPMVRNTQTIWRIANAPTIEQWNK